LAAFLAIVAVWCVAIVVVARGVRQERGVAMLGTD
jgi:hypothetical protein